MGQSFKPVTNFSGGEASPKLKGRPDVTPYYACADTLENVLVTHYGGAMRTPGTRFVARTKDMTKASRLIPFVFSAGDAFMLEFGDEYIRFFSQSGSVIGADVDITDATQADPCVVTCNTATLSNGDAIDIYDVEGMTELNGRRFLVANKTSTTIELTDEDGNDIDSTGYTEYDTGGVLNLVYEIESPYAAEDLTELKFTQQADIMYITHPDYAPRKLSRFGATNWTIAAVSWTSLNWPAFLDINTSATTLACSATTGDSKTLTASASLFDSTYVGSYMRLDHSTNKGYVLITAVASGTSATCNVIAELNATSATADWYEGAWSPRQGYPSDAKFFEQRLYYSATDLKPLTVWGSELENYEHFTNTDDDENCVSYTIGSNQVDRILWTYPTTSLNLGTAGGPFTMAATGVTETISVDNPPSVKQQNENGASSISPVRIGPYIYYVERSGRILGQLAYSLDSDIYETEDITYLSDHILGDGVKDMAIQRYPYNILWCVRNDGVVATMTRQVKNEVKGWTRQVMTGDDVKVEAVGCIPYGSEDQVWLVTTRTINEETVRYIEYVEQQEIGDQEDLFYVQCGLSYDGDPTDSLSGLEHLEGEEVAILIDGAVHPAVTVEDGMIDLEWEGSVIHVGLPYTSTIKTLDLEAGDGTGQGKVTHITKAMVRFYQSLGCKVGNGTTNDVIPFRSWGDNFGEAPMMFTGDKEVEFPSGHVKNKYIVIEQDQPLPLHVLGIWPKMLISY